MATVKITWLGHSTFTVELSDGTVVLIDPWLEGNPAHPKGYQLERVDLMLITHGHFDHIADAVAVAKRFGPVTVAIYEICQWLETKGVKNLAPMNKGGSQAQKGVTVTMTHALHSSMIQDDGEFICAGEAAGFVVRLPDGRAFYHAGDTAVFSDMRLIRELYKPELAMLPIGDLFTMDPKEAALACKLLKPSRVIPTHYGTFPPLTGTPAQLRKLLKDQPETRVTVLEAGVPFEW